MTLKQFFIWQYATSVQACFNIENFLAPQDTTATAFVFIMIHFNYFKQAILAGDYIQNYTFFSSAKNLERLLVFVVRVGEEGGAGWCRISAWSGRPVVEIGTLFVS